MKIRKYNYLARIKKNIPRFPHTVRYPENISTSPVSWLDEKFGMIKNGETVGWNNVMIGDFAETSRFYILKTLTTPSSSNCVSAKNA